MIPVIIIGFNNFTYIKMMVEQLLKYNLKDITIIDNCSTLPILLHYYENNKNFKVLKLNKNYGPRVLFHEDLKVFYNMLPNFFILTDPDIKFNENLPEDFVDTLISITEKHKIGKAGFAIDISSSEKFKHLFFYKRYKKISIRAWEHKYWTDKREDDLYRADIATTFAVYNKKYLDFSIERHRLKAMRKAGNFLCKHMQWYLDDMLPYYEKKYYIANSYYIGWNFQK